MTASVFNGAMAKHLWCADIQTKIGELETLEYKEDREKAILK